MDFLNDGDGRKISVEKWIEHWSRCYEQVYDDFDEYFENMNFSTGSLDDQNLAALCKWKDRQYWERLKKSFDALGLSQINNLRNTSPNDVDGIVFSTKEAIDLFISTRDLLNSKGLLTTDSVVWLTFILSVAVPSEFPIYDQNVRRTFRLFVRCWGQAKTESELVELVRTEVSKHQLLVNRRRLHKREIRSSGKKCYCDLCKGCCELCVTTPMNIPYKIGLNGEVQDFRQGTNFLRVATEYFVFRTWMLSLAEGIRSIRNEPDRESVKLSRRPDMAVLAFGKFIRDGKPNCTGEID